MDTAKYISESLGKLTVEYNTANSSSGSSFGSGVSSNSGAGVSQQFTGRDLLTPDEVMRLPNDVEIVQVQGEAPYTLRRLNYLTDPEYAGRFDSAFLSATGRRSRGYDGTGDLSASRRGPVHWPADRCDFCLCRVLALAVRPTGCPAGAATVRKTCPQ
ncbi:type IV secretory system conjugative DNA transfer family protein [Ochrobactrum daejeonense]|nr:type IV secretory system conjugative DNA transfer family protein [Brucella daejeonensis]